MTSARYLGAVRHRRHVPTRHRVRQRASYVLLDHAELGGPGDPTRAGGALAPPRRWPLPWWAVRYRREDYLDGDPATPLGEAVRDLVEARTGRRPAGAVRTLTQVRTHGYVFNPLTVHWCTAPGDDGRLEVVVLEVTSTPWRQRHCYVVDARPGATTSAPATDGTLPVVAGTLDRRGRLHATFPKAMHVSPFLGMDQTYRLTCTAPGERLWLRLENLEDGPDGPVRVLDADVVLRRARLTRRAVLAGLLRHPFPTHRVWLGIHAHAAVLAARRVPFSRHPDRVEADRRRTALDPEQVR